MEEKETQCQTRKKSRRRWVLAGILLLLVIVIAILALRFRGRSGGLEHERLAETGILPTMTAAEIQARLYAIVEEGMFNVSINGAIHFAEGNGEGDVCIENIAANHYPCTVRMYLTETGEEVLSTGLIDPGQYIYRMPLDRALRDGIYDCTAVFTAYDAETLEEMGKVNVNVIVVVGAD